MAERLPLPRRADYRAFFDVPTRWLDNDLYGHVNNVYYYVYFDTVIARVLMEGGGLDPWRDPVIGYCVESGCRFHKGARFPDRITAGIRVSRLGRSSVRYCSATTTTRRRPRASSSTFSSSGRASGRHRCRHGSARRWGACSISPLECPFSSSINLLSHPAAARVGDPSTFRDNGTARG